MSHTDPAHLRTLLANRVGRHFTDSLTDAEVNDLVQDPQKLQAFVTGFKPPSPPIIDLVETIPAPSLGSGAFGELPMLEPDNDENTEASARSIRANPHHKGAELPSETGGGPGHPDSYEDGYSHNS